MSEKWIPTELVLTNWRAGTTQAERLCAALIGIDGFGDIEPQAPTGGADGRKDILCSKGGIDYVGAVYFPTSQKSFQAIKKKFLHDLDGTVQHNKNGIVFLTNQRLTVNQRKKLETLAADQRKECLIYNVERLRLLLDSPTGYGIRLEFLKIPMNQDEQFAFFVYSGNTVEQAIANNTIELSRLTSKIDQVLVDQSFVVQTLQRIDLSKRMDAVPPPTRPDLKPGGIIRADLSVGPVVSNITPALISTFHRLSCYELPPRMVGKIRDETVWIGRASTTIVAGAIDLLPPDQIMGQLTVLCTEWNDGFSELKRATVLMKLQSISMFHSKFLLIHPYADGNGRVARAILMQQCIDLFGEADMSLMSKGPAYFKALQEADRGNYELLVEVIKPVVGK